VADLIGGRPHDLARSLFALIGAAAVVLLGLAHRQYARLLKWLLLTFPLGVVAELILGLVYNQSF
jgi:hypothetical protein